MSFKINRILHIKLFLLSLAGTVLFNKFFITIIESFIFNMKLVIGNSIVVNLYIYVFILIGLISVIHELIHGLFYVIYGGKVEFGFKVIYAYSREISQIELSRTRFLTVLLGPLVIISILALMLKEYSGIIFILNLLGSAGDIYMAFSLLKLKPESRIIDREYGYEVVK